MAPSLEHSALLLLFQNRPALALELLRGALGVAVDAAEPAQIESVDLTAALPAEYRADLVVRYTGGPSPLVVVVEVQLSKDHEKRYSWPAYVALLRARYRCPVWLLVVAPHAATARWCAKPIEFGNGAVFTPAVLSAEGIPVVVDASAARAAPELSVLSAMAHGGENPEQAVAIGLAGLAALEGLDRDRAVIYFDLMRAALSQAARKAIDAMIPQGYQFRSDIALENQALGEARGRREGEARGKANAVLAVLEARGITPRPEERERILSCLEHPRLDRWVRQAVTVSDSSELFQ